MSINFMRPNFEKQIEDLTFALENKFGKDIANEVRKHVEQKKSRWDYLPEKYIYVEEDESIYLDKKVNSRGHIDRYYVSGICT